MNSIFTKVQKLCLPIDIQLQFFDSMYGSAVWGFENNSFISQFQLKFYKYLLTLKVSTPSVMV
jgi:hypothetical protein